MNYSMAWFKGKCDRLKVPLFNVAAFFFVSHGKFSPLPRPTSTSAAFLSAREHSLFDALFRQVFRFFLFLFLGPALGQSSSLPYCPTHLSKTRKAHVTLFAMAFKLARLSPRSLSLHSTILSFIILPPPFPGHP